MVVRAGALAILGCLVGCATEPAPGASEPPARNASAAPQANTRSVDASTAERLSQATSQPMPSAPGGGEDKFGSPKGADDKPPEDRGEPEDNQKGKRKKRVMSAYTTDAEGKLSEEDVSRTIEGLGTRMRRCLAKDATVEVSLRVEASGETTNVNVPRSAPDDPMLRDCVKSALQAARFPAPTGHAAVSLGMTLNLKKDEKF